MDGKPEELTFRQKAVHILRLLADYIFRQVLLVDVVIFLVVMVTFVFHGPLNAIAVSERVFWAGMIVMLLGAVVTAATLFTGKSFGVPMIIRKPEEARRFLDLSPEINAEKEKRYNVGARLWFIGMGCVAISALVEQIFA